MVRDAGQRDAADGADILSSYDAELPLLTDFCRTIEDLITRVLASHGQQVHSIGARVKERGSVERKLRRDTEGKYSSLGDMTDIVGLRIITHFSDDVDAVGAIVEREFLVDAERSIDRRAIIEPDRFGYLSLHYIASLSEERAALVEYHRFRELACEIQVRSILQHAWAEIEHDLGYKAPAAIPKVIRRRFSRLAGLLELADEEFVHLRKEVEEYTREVASRLANNETESVLVDRDSIRAFMTSSPISLRVRERIVSATGAVLLDSSSVREHEADDIARRLLASGYVTIEEVETALERREDEIVTFALAYLGTHPRVGSEAAGEGAANEAHDATGEPIGEILLGEGIALFYLAYVTVAAQQSIDVAKRFLVDVKYRRRHAETAEGDAVEEFAQWLLKAYSKVVLEGRPIAD